VRPAVVQLSASLDAAANRAAVERALDAVDPAHGPDVVVLPEATMADFGRPDTDLRPLAEPLDGPFVDLLLRRSRALGATVVAGMFEATDDLPFNTLVVAGPDGDLVATYRKIHLYDSFGYRESERLAAGDLEPVVVPVGDQTLGLMTCYDLRFPELARALVDRGADVLAVPAAWVAGERKLDHWRTLLAARAIENTVGVVAAAQCGRGYTGHSMVLDASGVVLAEAEDEPAVLTATLEPEALRGTRETNPSLANRRMGVAR
jgi:predicted amidohydrolase